jgi:enterobacterial common antigen flippase
VRRTSGSSKDIKKFRARGFAGRGHVSRIAVNIPRYNHRCFLHQCVSNILVKQGAMQAYPVIKSQDATRPVGRARAPEKTSYGQILKSSALIGFSTLINLSIGVIRTKAMAVWLGPAGFGLMGLYSSIADLAQNIAGMGVNASGVRQIAEAVGTGETERIARAVVVLRRIPVVLGVLGAIVLVAFSRQVSMLTFGSYEHSTDVRLLSATVLFSCMSGGQAALIQGMRRISDLVKIGILSAALGAIIGIPIVYAFREDGIAPSLIGGSAISFIASSWYSRKVTIRTPSMTLAQIGHEAADLLNLGFAFMATGLMTTGASYGIRVFVLHKLGFEAAGFYQSAWTLGGMYLGVILNSMGTDFYPRLTAAAKDDNACNRLVNEQTEVSILLAAPGVIATLTLAPLVIALFYSSKFQEAVEVLRWLCLGMALRVISWPMGYIILAKGKRNVFFWQELAWTVLWVGLTWVCVAAFALSGAGIAFFATQVFHVLMIYLIAHRLSGFQYSAANLKASVSFILILGLVFCGLYGLPYPVAVAVGVLALTATSTYSVRHILNLVSPTLVPRPILSVLEWLRLVAATT